MEIKLKYWAKGDRVYVDSPSIVNGSVYLSLLRDAETKEPNVYLSLKPARHIAAGNHYAAGLRRLGQPASFESWLTCSQIELVWAIEETIAQVLGIDRVLCNGDLYQYEKIPFFNVNQYRELVEKLTV